MSAIHFHSEQGTANLRGSERAYMGSLCNSLMLAAIGNLEYAKDWLIPLLPPNNYALRDPRGVEEGLALYLGGMGSTLLVNKESVDTFVLSLNTSIILGSNPVILLARLHGQCECHCWISGPNRKWLANIITDGRKTGLYREFQGWEDVIGLLKSRKDGPVVCSFSVCDSFPNYNCLPEDHPLKQSRSEDRYDQFYELPKTETWKECFRGLREQRGLELRPDNWENFYFDSGQSVFTLPRTSQHEFSKHVTKINKGNLT